MVTGASLGVFVSSILLIWMLAFLFRLPFRKRDRKRSIAITVFFAWLLVGMSRITATIDYGPDAAFRAFGRSVVPGVIVLVAWLAVRRWRRARHG